MTTDKELIKARFEASFATYNELAHVQRLICDRLAESAARLCSHDVRRALEIGAGTGFLTRHLVARWPRAKWYLNDLIPATEHFLAPQVADVDVEYLWGDAEKLPYPAALDLIASTSTAQWFEDKPAFAWKVAEALNPGGYLVLSLFGPENFREIKAAAGEGLEYFPLTYIAAVFERTGFRILSATEYIETLSFATPRDVLQYIKSLGVNSVKKTKWSSGKMEEFETRYRELFSTPDGGVTLTYHPLLLIAERER